MTWAEHGPDALGELLDNVTLSSWRWECQGDYSAIDADLMRRWRAGLGRDPAADQPWIDYVQDLVQRGIPFQRVRLLTDPITEYLRCQLDVSYMNVDAGEDIRWVEQHAAARLGMPAYDYYLIDDARVAVLVFGDNGLLAGLRTSTAGEVISQHRRWRDVIWPHAVPHRQFLAGLTARKDQ
ncbi:DUF6879 family protein [Amycolatopsis suaedae]|uniref:DUF6879 domain-containing protein n=1 Tax=Amycolatopsis suaedae TaxID=2510978 RepID=A0A4Q7J0F6_9PSEU|nr:DUF6879 family protein [Amycolatopsis suaedae]RZQ59853.1 hypothetical protein EWH70_32590 [Amycolatopsis suaedae]